MDGSGSRTDGWQLNFDAAHLREFKMSPCFPTPHPTWEFLVSHLSPHRSAPMGWYVPALLICGSLVPGGGGGRGLPNSPQVPVALTSTWAVLRGSCAEAAGQLAVMHSLYSVSVCVSLSLSPPLPSSPPLSPAVFLALSPHL